MSNREVLAVRDRTNVQNQTDDSTGAWTKLAQDAWSASCSVGREARLLGQGVVGGFFVKGYDAIANNGKQTAVHLAESVAIGGALAIASKSGPAPIRLLAAGVGGYFGYQMSDWMKNDVFNGSRWSAIGSAVSDTWRSGANLDSNIAKMQNNAGTILFDSALMFGGGYAGAKLGAAGAHKMSNFEFSFLKRGSQLAPELTSVAALETAGRFKADLKRVDANDPLVKLDEVIASKKKRPSTHDPRDIAGLLKESKMLDLANKDSVARDLRDVKAPELQKQNTELQRTTDKLNAEIKVKQKELTAVDTLLAEKKSVQAAEARLQSLEKDAGELAGKRTELRTLEEQIGAQAKAREEAKKNPVTEATGARKAQEAKAVEAEATQYEALREQARELRRDISEKEAATDRTNPNSAFKQADSQLQAARKTLSDAEANRPARMSQIQAEIESLRGGVAENTTRQQAIAQQAQKVVESYYARLSDLIKDPSSLQPVQATEALKVKPENQRQSAETLNAETARLIQGGGKSDVGAEVTSVKEKLPAERIGQAVEEKPVQKSDLHTVKSTDAGKLVIDQALTTTSKQVVDLTSGAKPLESKTVEPVRKSEGKSEVKSEATSEQKSATKEQRAEAASPELKGRLEAEARVKSALDNAKPAVTEAAERLKVFDEAREIKRRTRQQLDSIKSELDAIESGKTQFADQLAKQQKVEALTARQKELNVEIEKAQDSVKRVGSGHYFQAMKGIRRYSASVEEFFAKEPDAVRRNEFAKEAVRNLEAMLDELPKARQGTRPPSDNLSRRGFAGKDIERITQIREHADRRLDQMNHKHEGRNQSLLELKPVKRAFDKVTSGELRNEIPDFVRKQLEASQQRISTLSKPEGISDRDWKQIQSRVQSSDIVKMANDPVNVEAVMNNSSVVFFDQQGSLIGQIGTDGRFRPKYFDVPSILRGPGRGGAGVDRLQGESLGGFAMIGPQVRLTFGGRLELHNIGTNSKAEPIYSKEVMSFEGKVGPKVEVGVPANKLSPASARPRTNTGGDGRVNTSGKKTEGAS